MTKAKSLRNGKENLFKNEKRYTTEFTEKTNYLKLEF